MFGQAICGPPGSGKTTYCLGMETLFSELDRKVQIVNLDPANDEVPYDCAINVQELITIEDAMEEYNLGPNGGLVFCMEYLRENIDWLIDKLKASECMSCLVY